MVPSMRLITNRLVSEHLLILLVLYALTMPAIRAFTAVAVTRRPQQSVRLFTSNTSTQNNSNTQSLRLLIPTAEDMHDLGAVLAVTIAQAKMPFVICLDGDLGAGKTALSRGFVRSWTGDFDMRVTSPTYLLSNVYKSSAQLADLYHMDLYRLKGDQESDFRPLNLPLVFSNCVSLVEWPERLIQCHLLPRERLHITINIDSSTDSSETIDDQDISRNMTIVAYGSSYKEQLRNVIDNGYIEDMIVDV